MRIRWWLLVAALFISILSSVPTGAQNKDIVGRIERVRIYPGDLVLRAKLDTGARNSSLNGPSMTKFEKNGETWVRFSVKNHRGQEATIERKIIRQAKIKQKNQDSERRPVIMLGICLGRQYREVEVNLVDRAEFNYQMLIGRSFMIGHLVVDPELKFTAEPDCVGAPMP
jgi:hypothetical protein